MATVALRSNGGKSKYDFPGKLSSDSAGQSVVQFAQIDLAANVSANDILAFVTIPKGHTIIDGAIRGFDIDINATETLDFDVGTYTQAKDGTVTVVDVDAFGNFGTVTGDAVTGIKPEVGIYMPFNGTLMTDGPLALTVDTLICITVVTDAATFTAGNLNLFVTYVKTDTAEITEV